MNKQPNPMQGLPNDLGLGVPTGGEPVAQPAGDARHWPLSGSVAEAISRRLHAAGLGEGGLAIVDAGRSRRDGPLSQFGRSLRERFQAMTDIGLSPPAAEGPSPLRHVLPGEGAAPDLGYLSAGDPSGQTVLFIHGTPGAGADWTPFLKAAPEGQHRIAVDRPGFGQSGPGAPIIALAEQAGALARLLRRGSGPAVVVGSSYGGPVALQLAAGHPDVVSGVVVVGSAGDPAQEKPHPVQHLAAVSAVGRLLPRALRHSNAELLALRAELDALAHRLSAIRAPVTILQGLQDTLVPPENAPYIAERLAGAARRRVVLVERAGHFLHILRSGLVEAALADLLEGPLGSQPVFRAS